VYESLHNHTKASDGTQNYFELLETARRNQVGVIAFTDHDSLPTAGDLEKLADYDGPVKWLVGCEISSGLPVELGGGVTSSLHILGLFTSPTNKPLLEHCVKAVSARAERMSRIVVNLKTLGFTISEEDCLAASGGENIGRPHIVRALGGHAENAQVIEKLRADMERAAIVNPQIAMNYAHMMERPASDYPYRLFLSDDAFVPGVYVDYLYSVDMDTAVGLIRGAGGVAVVAHWYTVERKINAEFLERLLRDGRIDGVELMGNPINSSARRAEPLLSAIAARTGSITTYGIDAHREADIESFTNDSTVATKTIGQTHRLIERVKPDLAWSNLG
jgi:predicted metal-dependent phosphoesterase TrpH